MKKNKIYLLLVILLSVLFVKGVEAKSEYFNHIWTYDADETTEFVGYVTNDVIEIDGGYLSVGFRYDEPEIRVLNADGSLKKSVSINDNYRGRLKKVFAVDGGYVAIGIDGEQLYSLVLNSKFKVVDSNNYWTSSWYWDSYEIYAIKHEDSIYIFNDYFYYSDVVEYSIDNDSFDSIKINAVPKAARNIINNYAEIVEYDSCSDVLGGSSNPLARSKDTLASGNYCSTFIKPYNEGYVFGLYDWDNEKSLVVYYTDDEEWSKTYSDRFIKDGVQVGENFLVVGTTNDDTNFYLYDKTGKIIETTDVTEYLEDSYEYFNPEHLIAVPSGFMLAGSGNTCGTDLSKAPSKDKAPEKKDGDKAPEKKDGDKEPPEKPSNEEKMTNLDNCYEDKLLYFAYDYKIEVKTDDNGSVSVNKIRSSAGEVVEFTVEPKKGYVLGEVKVTDANGNVIVFKENKFTMPSADVLIEAVFIKSQVNPATATGIGIGLLIIVALASGYYVLKQRKAFK